MLGFDQPFPGLILNLHPLDLVGTWHLSLLSPRRKYTRKSDPIIIFDSSSQATLLDPSLSLEKWMPALLRFAHARKPLRLILWGRLWPTGESCIWQCQNKASEPPLLEFFIDHRRSHDDDSSTSPSWPSYRVTQPCWPCPSTHNPAAINALSHATRYARSEKFSLGLLVVASIMKDPLCPGSVTWYLAIFIIQHLPSVVVLISLHNSRVDIAV